MATQKENKMSRMKGAFGKMKSSKMKFNMTKPGNSGKSTKQLRGMFNRFNKSKDDDQKWASILSGSWEIELPVGEFLNAPPPSSTDNDSSQSDHKVNDPNSVSSRQCPMVQIYENLKVISLPLPTDIGNPHIHKKYLDAKSITTNSTRIKLKSDDKNSNKIHLIHINNDKENENDMSNIILEGTINTTNYTIRWSDGSSWNKQGIQNITKEEEEEESTTINNTLSNDENMNELRQQLEIFREKEMMAKSQTQAIMGQFADLSNQYAKLTEEKETFESKMEEYNVMKETLDANNIELNEIRNKMEFKTQQEIQGKLTTLKKENSEYSESIKLQQERILSLQDQLQTSHIATRQYTKTIEDLELKIKTINKDKIEIKQVLNEMNNKFVTSQTNLDDAKHKEMIVNDKHEKQIKLLNDKHQIEIKKLEHGFQETLRQNERKIQEMQTIRNSYEKKNASLTKDVKKLIIQLEKQANNTYNNSITKSMDLSADLNDESEVISKLKMENKQLSDELVRKSQSLVDALRALAEFNRNPVDIVPIAKAYIYENNTKNEKGNVKSKSVSPSGGSESKENGIVIGATYGINDINAMQMDMNSTKHKFNRFKNKFGNKMKEQITKIQQKKVNEEIQKRKSVLNEEEMLNELNAKTAIKESEKVMITKTKLQLKGQCDELQGLANELSSTIEQKEVILESLRFANTYLGKRVIALEKLMNFKPGKEIKNQEQLIKDALNITPRSNENENVEQNENELNNITGHNNENDNEEINIELNNKEQKSDNEQSNNENDNEPNDNNIARDNNENNNIENNNEQNEIEQNNEQKLNEQNDNGPNNNENDNENINEQNDNENENEPNENKPNDNNEENNNENENENVNEENI